MKDVTQGYEHLMESISRVLGPPPPNRLLSGSGFIDFPYGNRPSSIYDLDRLFLDTLGTEVYNGLMFLYVTTVP
jgi:hypothetical protein